MKLIIIKLLVTISVVCLVKGYYYEDLDEDEDVKSLVKRQANYYYNDNLDTTTVTTKRIISNNFGDLCCLKKLVLCLFP